MVNNSNLDYEAITDERRDNLTELNVMLETTLEELSADDMENWCEDEEPFENSCFLRYYIDGCGIYFSELGEIVFDDTMPAANFELNLIEETELLKPYSELPEDIKHKLITLRELNKKYCGRKFAVVAVNKDYDTVIISSERHRGAYWELKRDTFDSLDEDMILTLEKASPDSSFAHPVQAI